MSLSVQADTATFPSVHPIPERLSQRLRLLSADNQNQRLRRECLQLALETSAYAEAETLARALRTQEPTDESVLAALSNALIGQKKYADALDVLQQAPATNNLATNRAISHYMLAQYPLALPFLECLYAAEQRDTGTLRLLVSTLHHLGEIDRAVQIATQNPQPAATDGPLAGVYALVFLDNAVPDQAAFYARIALSRNPDSIDGLTVQATLQTANSQLAAARDSYARIVALRPENGRSWIGLGAISMQQQDFKTAKEQLQKGLQYMPDHTGSWVTLGWNAIFLGDLSDAEHCFEKALELDRNFADVHGSLAVLAIMKGKSDEAARLVKIARSLDPESLSARYAHALVVGQSGNTDDAKKLIAKLVADVQSLTKAHSSGNS